MLGYLEDPLQFLTPFLGGLRDVSLRRHSPLSLKVVEKRPKVDSFGASVLSGVSIPQNFYGTL